MKKIKKTAPYLMNFNSCFVHTVHAVAVDFSLDFFILSLI